MIKGFAKIAKVKLYIAKPDSFFTNYGQLRTYY